MKNRCLVISIDALITADIERLRALPQLRRVMHHAAIAKDIYCVYPTLTYPCHASIATGCWPDRTGIVNNELFQPLKKGRADWYWFRSAIRVPTIIDYAKKHGLTTSTVTWPVMGASGADWNIGEIWAPEEHDDPTPWFKQADSPDAESIFEKNKHLLCWMKTPQMDEFAAQCAADIIRAHKPDLMLLHLSRVDHQRHRLGVHSPNLDEAFAFVDGQIGKVFDALEETGGLSNTNVVLLGDHGQMYCDQLFHINALFEKNGWITLDADGNIADWKVYAAQCSFSVEIYLKPEMDKDAVYQKLLQMQKDYPEAIERVFTKKEAADMHLNGEFDFVIEAAPRTAFDKTAKAETLFMSVHDEHAYKLSVSTHGHLPEKGDKPPFIICGPDAKADALVTGGRLVDETPTILRLLGFDEAEINSFGMDGKVLPLVQA